MRGCLNVWGVYGACGLCWWDAALMGEERKRHPGRDPLLAILPVQLLPRIRFLLGGRVDAYHYRVLLVFCGAVWGRDQTTETA